MIGALGAGCIGPLLVETTRTARDLESTRYIIILVIMMDSLSISLRRELIEAEEGRR